MVSVGFGGAFKTPVFCAASSREERTLQKRGNRSVHGSGSTGIVFLIAGKKKKKRRKISVTVGTTCTDARAYVWESERAHTCFLSIGCFWESEVMFLVPSRKRATLQVPFQLSLRDR